MKFINVYDNETAKTLVSKGFKLVKTQDLKPVKMYTFEYNKDLACNFSKDEYSKLQEKIEVTDNFEMMF